jgi:hypothetical protein
MPDPEQPVGRGLIPWTGEVVDLADTPKVIDVLDRARRWHDEVYRPAIRQLEQAVLDQMDADNHWTYRAGGLVASSGSPETAEKVRYEEIPAMRQKLKAAGMSEEALARVVKTTVTHRVMEGEAKKLLKNPRYQAIVAEHRVYEPAPRRVTVKLDT